MDKAFEYLNDKDRALLEKKGEVLEVEKDHDLIGDTFKNKQNKIDKVMTMT